MPNKTIYVREADREVWERAEELAGGSVSALITEALRRYVTEQDERKERGGMEAIEIELWGADDRPYRAEFNGWWLLHPDEVETRTGEPGYDAGAYWGVAETEKGNIAVYIRHCNDRFAPQLGVYGSFEQAEKAGVPSDILAQASEDYVQKLDI